MKEQLLLFNLPDASLRLKLEMILFPLKIRLKTAAKEDYLKPLGFLAGTGEVSDNGQVYDGPELSDTMLIFAGIPDNKLNRILADMRRMKIGPFPHKAVLTPTNQFWNALECFEEIHAEHMAMAQRAAAEPENKTE